MATLVAMRVLICSQSHGPALPAVTVGEALRSGWLAQRPADEIDLRPLADGGTGFLAVVLAAELAEPTLITISPPQAPPIPVTVGRGADGVTWWLETSDAALADERDRSLPPDFTRSTVRAGLLLGAVVRAGAQRVIVGSGGARRYDGGLGFLAGLALALDIYVPDVDSYLHGVSTLGGRDANLGWSNPDRSSLGWIAEVVQRLADVELLGACDVEAPLLGMGGVGAGYATNEKIAPERGAALNSDLTKWAATAHREAQVAREVQVAREAQVGSSGSAIKLLPLADARGAGSQRPGMAQHTGAGGGVGFALSLLGADLQDGAAVLVSELNIAGDAASFDLVVSTVGELEWRALSYGALVALGEVVAPSLTPLIAVAEQVQVGRREWARVGLSATYQFEGIGGGGVGQKISQLGAAENALRDAGGRLAVTWSR